MVAREVHDFGGIRIVTVDWPIMLMEITEHRVTDDDLRAALARFEAIMRECHQSREKFALVTDLSKLRHLPPASQRKIAADWVNSTSELQKVTNVGGANVTPSAIIRGIVTAIYWLARPATPAAFVATRDEAMQQAIRWLEQDGAPLPPSVVVLRDKLERQTREKQRSAWSWPR
jgi:hypothetical protein